MNLDLESGVKIVQELKSKGKINSYVLTGAGISRASKIPTFRGEDGLWEKYNFEEVATLGAWLKNPSKLWTFYAEGIELILNAKPNPAHESLTKLQELGYCQHIITQNADNLHQKAGSKDIIEIHGNMTRVRCMECKEKQAFLESPKEIPPMCKCGGMQRPDVVLFNEQLPHDLINKAFEIAQKANLVFVIGTSAEVVPAATLPFISMRNGAKILVFNREKTGHVQFADCFIAGKCEESLPKFLKLLINE